MILIIHIHIIHIKHIPKTKYATLGSKLFCCNKLAITRRIKHLNQIIRKNSKAQDLYYNVAVSKHDLKHDSKICMRPWIRSLRPKPPLRALRTQISKTLFLGTSFGFGIWNLKLIASRNRLSIVPSLQNYYFI